MDAAKGNAKVDSMAAVIDELVSQRKAIMSNMVSPQSKMLVHMGEHMGSVRQPGHAAVDGAVPDDEGHETMTHQFSPGDSKRQPAKSLAVRRSSYWRDRRRIRVLRDCWRPRWKETP